MDKMLNLITVILKIFKEKELLFIGNSVIKNKENLIAYYPGDFTNEHIAQLFNTKFYIYFDRLGKLEYKVDKLRVI